VVGSTLPALLYAFKYNYPVFFTDPQRPFQFDFLAPDVDLSSLKIPGAAKSLTTTHGVKKVGTPKEILWERLLFLLALDGKFPLANLCDNIRYDNEHMVCSNEYSKIAEVNFNLCHYFGDDKANGFEKQKRVAKEYYMCYDYIAFNRGGKHEIDYIKTNDDLVSEIWFYPSDRIDGATRVKDACAVSKLTKKQLHDFDYSETMARFKTVSEMETRGMKGLFNGYGPNGKPKYYKFRTSTIGRKKYRIDNEGISECPRVKICQDTEESLLKDLQSAIVAYDRFLE